MNNLLQSVLPNFLSFFFYPHFLPEYFDFEIAHIFSHLFL